MKGTIATSRVFDAPRERVYAAFGDPETLAKWWGPDGFTSTFEVFELRPGGEWRFVFHAPDGSSLPNNNRFVEVDPPARVVIHHVQEGHDFTLTIRWEELGPNKTRVTWTQVFADPAEAERIRVYVEPANEQNLNRLGAQL